MFALNTKEISIRKNLELAESQQQHLNMSLSKSTNAERAQTVVPCDLCKNDKVAGEHYCVECKQTMCPMCEAAHRNGAFTKLHTVIMRSQIASAQSMSIHCGEHGDQIVTLRCKKCKILVCIKCVTGTHRSHPMNDISNIYEKEKRRMEQGIAKMKDEDLPALQTVLDKSRTERKQYLKDMEKLRQEMEDEARTYKLEIDQAHAKRMQMLSLLEKDNLSKFEDFEKNQETRIAECTQMITAQKDVIRKGSQPALLRFLEQSSTPLPGGIAPVKIARPTVKRVPHTKMEDLLCKIESPHKLTRKVISPRKISSFKTGLQGYPRICLTKEGLAIVGGTDESILVLMDKKGKVHNKRKTKNRPYALAMMMSGDIIMSPTDISSTVVIKLRTDGTEQVVFDTSPSPCYGVSVTRDQDILICTGDVVRCDGDGNNVKQLYYGSESLTAVHAVESNDGNIYISDNRNSRLVVINREGEQISTVERPLGRGKFSPWGLACDSMGNILCADLNNNCVYIIEPSGEVKELLGSSFGIRQPRWLAVDKDNNLWITSDVDRTVTVVKYLQ